MTTQYNRYDVLIADGASVVIDQKNVSYQTAIELIRAINSQQEAHTSITLKLRPQVGP